MKRDNNNIIFRASWFKTLERWEPSMVKEFITALNDFHQDKQLILKNERVIDLWDQVEPLLIGDRDRYNKRSETNSKNGKLGGAPKGNTNASKNQPNTSEIKQIQAKQPIDKEIEIDKEKDNENDIDKDKDNTSLNSSGKNSFTEQSISIPTKIEEEFAKMFLAFNADEKYYQLNLNQWWNNFSEEDRINSLLHYTKYIHEREKNKKVVALKFYLDDKSFTRWVSETIQI